MITTRSGNDGDWAASGVCQRNRLVHAALGFLVMLLGLLWRSHLVSLPPAMTKYGGDALWALLVFLGFGFCFAKTPTLKLALAALCFSWAVEFSQLYDAPWIDAVRGTRMGALILGSNFNAPDLAAYLFGIAVGGFGERFYTRTRRKTAAGC